MNPQIPEVIIGESLTRVTPTRLFGPHDTFLTAVAYSDDGQRLVTGDIEGYLRVWETETGQLLARRRVFNSAVLGAVFNRTNPGNVYELTVASTGNDVTVLTLGADHSISEAKALTLDTFRVLQIAYNAQNRPLIACIPTSEYDKRVYLMYGDDKAFIHAFNLSNDEYPNAAFSFDGTLLAVGKSDGTVTIRTTEKSGVSLHKIATDFDGVRQTAFSPDGERLAVLESNGDRVRIYTIATGETVGTLINSPFHNQFAFNVDGKLLAVTTQQKGGSLHIYNVETGQRLRRVKGSSPLAFSPLANSYACGNNYAEFSKSIMLWDTRASEDGVIGKIGAPIDNISAEKQTIAQITVLHSAHEGKITSMAFSPDGMTLATAGTDNDIQMWDMSTGGQIATLVDHKADVTSLSYSPDGKTLASSSGYFNNRDDNTVRLWDAEECTPKSTFNKHKERVVDVVMHPRGELIVSADATGRLYIWRAFNGEVLRSIDTPSPINHIALSPDGALIATAHGSELAAKDNALRLWNVQTGERIREFSDMSDWVIDVTFNPDGNTLLATDYSDRVMAWDMSSGEKVLDLSEGELARYNPQNDLIAIAHGKNVSLVSVRSAEPKMELRHGEDVTSIAFNDEGELLAVGLASGDIAIWGVPDGGGIIANTTSVDLRRLVDAARSGRYAFQLISLTCNKAQERDGDEIFIRVDDQTIWSVKKVGRKMSPKPTRNNEINTFDFSQCRMHGKRGWQSADQYRPKDFRFRGLTGPIELELWEEDQFLRGGNDYIGKVTITPAQAGKGMVRAVIGDETDQFSYTLTYGVTFE
ncbi:MAG: WD40 repeat domain-containing protein [Chloroflexota bacterium]